ncbi:MAG: hypothetical protein ABIH50_02335 [bacterium]
MAKTKHHKKTVLPSAERILQWLEEANQFARMFLSPEKLLKWEKVKNQQSKQPSS